MLAARDRPSRAALNQTSSAFPGGQGAAATPHLLPPRLPARNDNGSGKIKEELRHIRRPIVSPRQEEGKKLVVGRGNSQSQRTSPNTRMIRKILKLPQRTPWVGQTRRHRSPSPALLGGEKMRAASPVVCPPGGSRLKSACGGRNNKSNDRSAGNERTPSSAARVNISGVLRGILRAELGGAAGGGLSRHPSKDKGEVRVGEGEYRGQEREQMVGLRRTSSSGDLGQTLEARLRVGSLERGGSRCRRAAAE